MTDNELKFKVLEMAITEARDQMFTKRMVLENRWQHSTPQPEFPDLPEVDIAEAIMIYCRLMDAIIKR
jgi:hypothetical protein